MNTDYLKKLNVIKSLTAVTFIGLSFNLRHSAQAQTIVAQTPQSLMASEKPQQKTIHSNSEGALSSEHLKDLQKYRTQYFYDTEGKISEEKLNALLNFLNQQKNLLASSAKMSKKTNLIFNFGADNKEADKKGEEALTTEAEALAPFLFAIEHTEELKRNYLTLNPSEVHEKVETILLFLVAGYTPHGEGLYKSAKDRLTNLARNFFDFNKNDRNLIPASNLLDSETGTFLTLEKVRKLQNNKFDISKLNPPSSAFWTNNGVEAYDAYNEIYFGEKLFPDRSIEIPTFYYERMGNGNIKIKTKFLDTTDLNKKGEPKKKSVTIRLGHEAYATVLSSHLARAVGYPANPNTFRKKIKLVLGDISFEQFVQEWMNAHGSEQGTPLTHIERIAGENAVYIKNANLEAYPKDELYRKMGPFRMGDNGFGNRREYRGMVLYTSLISLQDQFEYQSRVDAYRSSEKNLWKPIYFISDVGQSLGLPTWGNTGTVNEYSWNFTWTDDNEVKLFWVSIFNSKTWEKATYSDVKWMARRYARLSSKQIDDITKASGLPAPMQALYSAKIKSRINKMIKDFDLDREGFKPHSIPSKKQLSEQYPLYISEDGYLKEGAQQIEGNTIPILGNQFTPAQAVKSLVLSTFSSRLTDLITTQALTEKITKQGFALFDLGQTQVESGQIYEATRKVSVNSEVGPDQKRYLIKDTLSLGIPLGFMNDNLKTPAALFYIYKYEFSHSVNTLQETATSSFFKKMNPFYLTEIKQNLASGEQLLLTHSYGASVGELKVKAFEQLQVEAALIGLSQTTIKKAYFTKSSTLLEAFVTHFQNQSLRVGLDIRAAFRLAFMFQKNKTEQKQSYYKLDLLNQNLVDQNKMNEAYKHALIDNDFSQLNLLTQPLTISQVERSKNLDLGLFLWNRDKTTSISEINMPQQKVILAKRSTYKDRSFDRLWNNKKSGASISLLNFFGNLTNEGELFDIAFEGTVNQNADQYSKYELNLSYSKIDKYTKRKELLNDFFKAFNQRAGNAKYIEFPIPEEIEQYIGLEGQMRWQLSSKAVQQILESLSRGEGLDHIANQDWAQSLQTRATALKDIFNQAKPTSVNQLKKASKDLVELIEDLVGNKGQDLASLFKITSKNDIWVITKIEDFIKSTNPTFGLRSAYWAEEIGQFQGHSDLNVFRRTQLTQPLLSQ